MTIRTKFRVDVYSCVVHIIVCSDVRKSVNYYCKKYDPEDCGIEYKPDGFFFKPFEKIGTYYIWFDLANVTVNTINHEKSHLAEEILKDRGIRAHGEQRAYLEGFLSEKITEFFNHQRNNIKFK